jgi:indolepyruvate ferredoxin oxidoreductase alpha subunit
MGSMVDDRNRTLLSGNEALALGAFEAGVKVAAGYPGTPSTEILESLGTYPGVYCEWSSNEKVALDVAIGAAYAGRRALAVMKHVGLNVAADSLFYAAYTGLGGAGLAIAVADDPGMHSSQNEQDTRHYARFAQVPMVEPADSSEARDMLGHAFAISEQFDVPVLVRMSTRVSHSRGVVEVARAALAPGKRRPALVDPVPVPDPHTRSPREALAALAANPGKYVMVPGNARGRHPVVRQRLADMARWAENCALNQVEFADRTLGVLASGIAYQYAREVLTGASFLKLGLVWPLPVGLLRRFAAGVDRLLVVEELDPFLEENLRLLGLTAEGKRWFPAVGELSPAAVRRGAAQSGLFRTEVDEPAAAPPLPPRPPVLCPGCGHRPVFHVLRRLGAVVFGDIGCYTLGAMPPLSAIHTCGCMGSGLANLHGVVKALAIGHQDRRDAAGVRGMPVAVIGDSTFYHAGLPALANLVYNQGGGLVIIADNSTTAMTGHQDHPGTGRTLAGGAAPRLDPAEAARGLGVSHVATIDPFDLDAFLAIAREFLASREPAVIVARHPCALQSRSRRPPVSVVGENCNGCGLCLQLGCPPLSPDDGRVLVDQDLCTGCGLCAAVCPRQALVSAPNRGGGSAHA